MLRIDAEGLGSWQGMAVKAVDTVRDGSLTPRRGWVSLREFLKMRARSRKERRTRDDNYGGKGLVIWRQWVWTSDRRVWSWARHRWPTRHDRDAKTVEKSKSSFFVHEKLLEYESVWVLISAVCNPHDLGAICSRHSISLYAEVERVF